MFLYRQATGFRPVTPEPDEGWMGELAAGWFQVAADLERDVEWQLPAQCEASEDAEPHEDRIPFSVHDDSLFNCVAPLANTTMLEDCQEVSSLASH